MPLKFMGRQLNKLKKAEFLKNQSLKRKNLHKQNVFFFNFKFVKNIPVLPVPCIKFKLYFKVNFFNIECNCIFEKKTLHQKLYL